MILITGAAGFIGSAFVWKLNSRGIKDIIAVDKFHNGEKWKNLQKRDFYDWVDKDELFDWLKHSSKTIKTIVHFGACTNTTEKDSDFLIRNNYEYSKRLWQLCVKRKISFLYASSAATYGAGEKGYNDDEAIIPSLKPLNPYGWSKHIFDKWILKQETSPPNWVGFKFFNVYGPNEYHKGQMSSVIFHAFNQAKKNGTIRLFKSYRKDFGDGEQKRDFVYIKDVVDIVEFFMNKKTVSGIYNNGTGKARTFNSLAQAVFQSMGKGVKIQYFDMPEHVKNQYQYFTEARIDKIRQAGYNKKMDDLEAGVKDYIQSYLDTDDPYL